MSTNYKILCLTAFLNTLFAPNLCQMNETTEIVTNSSSNTIIIINNSEIFNLFFTLNVFIWISFLLIIVYGIYECISNRCLLKALLLGGRDQAMPQMFAITIIASDPSLAYDYDNSSIRIDLYDKNNDSIASLLMRPLWAFHSIQPKPNSNPLWKTPKEEETDIYGPPATVNLCRQVPLIGVYKMVTDKNLNKVQTIMLGHDCPHPNASVLVRCVEIINLSSLIAHNYPMNTYLPHLSQPIGFVFSNKERHEFEFDSEDLSPRAHYQRNSPLNLIERTSFLLISFNIISFQSYLWSQSYDYETDKEWLMWYKALLLSLVIGSLVSVIHLMTTLSYRLFKEYNLYFQTIRTKCIKQLIIWTVLMISLVLLMATLGIGYYSIRSTIFLRWYRISCLSALVFMCMSTVLTFISLFVRIKPKLRNENSFDASTLKIPKEGEPQKFYEMIVQNCTALEIDNLKNVPILGSAWLRSALDQHKGLERAIFCDVYDISLLPKGEVTTILAQNMFKLFGESNTKNRPVAYATRFIEQNGMAVSVSQYGHKKANEDTPKKDKEVLNTENKQ